MKCRKCNRPIDFVEIRKEGRARVYAIHARQKRGLNDQLVSPGYRRKLRRRLEATCAN